MRKLIKHASWLILNWTLLFSAGALFFSATDYYMIGEARSTDNGPQSPAIVRSAYLHTIVYSVAGAILLWLGARGEAKRLSALDKRIQARKNRAAQEKIARLRSRSVGRHALHGP